MQAAQRLLDERHAERALVRSTSRRGRALLGFALGIADLVVLAFLVAGNGVVAWNFGG
ncbi:hypothetical protein [Streptomyces atratus]|uniref:hypothetical protein n=1 Tax=Streptomyces atratus TaxID=1893 RepID=UPI003869FE6D